MLDIPYRVTELCNSCSKFRILFPKARLARPSSPSCRGSVSVRSRRVAALPHAAVKPGD